MIRNLATTLLSLLLLVFASAASSAAALTDLPLDKGLPVVVQVAVSMQSLDSFDENTCLFQSTADIRLRWEDPRLAKPADQIGAPPSVYRDRDAEARIAEIWVPVMEIVNQRGDATYRARGLRIFSDGTVELTTRISASFQTIYDVERFPFDTQRLRFEIAIRNQTADQISLRFDQEDLDFSRASSAVALGNWQIGVTQLSSEPLPGWYSATHPQVIAAVSITREPGLVVAAIFIPLIASLLIPILAIWLNRIDDGVFQIETFELVNLVIGGLFAVIALNFTVYSTYSALTTGDNAVNQLFALNYITLGISLSVNILFYRFNIFQRLFGRYVQEQIYLFLMWAIPVLVLSTAACSILNALV